MRLLRNDSTPEGKAIWDAVDKAAARAPWWVKQRLGVADRDARIRELDRIVLWAVTERDRLLLERGK